MNYENLDVAYQEAALYCALISELYYSSLRHHAERSNILKTITDERKENMECLVDNLSFPNFISFFWKMWLKSHLTDRNYIFLYVLSLSFDSNICKSCVLNISQLFHHPETCDSSVTVKTNFLVYLWPLLMTLFMCPFFMTSLL